MVSYYPSVNDGLIQGKIGDKAGYVSGCRYLVIDKSQPCRVQSIYSILISSTLLSKYGQNKKSKQDSDGGNSHIWKR